MAYLPIIAACLSLVLLLSIVWTTLSVGISPMPSSRRAQSTMLDLVPDDVTGTVVELGSGWGQIARSVARRWGHLSVIGYELSPIPWMWSVITTGAHRPRLRFYRRDFFDADLSSVGVVLCYLYPDAMTRISENPRIFAPGTVLISNTFRVPGWVPDEMVELDDLYRTRVYRYVL